jgi:hypothetical protein
VGMVSLGFSRGRGKVADSMEKWADAREMSPEMKNMVDFMVGTDGKNGGNQNQ